MAVRVLADASFLVSAVVNEHIYKDYALSLLKSEDKKFVITIFSLEEMLFVLRKKYHLSFDELNKTITVLMNSDAFLFLEITNQNKIVGGLVNALERFGLKGRDAIHYLIMRRYKIRTIVTFDGDFIKRQKDLGIKVLTLARG